MRHPLLARGERLALYVAVWMFAAALLAALLASQADIEAVAAAAVAIPLSAVYSFVCLSAWYVARATPLAASGLTRLVATAMGASVLSSSAWLMLARVWQGLLERWTAIRAPVQETGSLIFGLGILLYLLSIAVAYVVVAFEHAREAERGELQAEVLAREAELRTLRAQIDPHFLFNSLHSISALTAVDAAGARRMTILLGDFLRESLALGALDRIPLASELTLVEKYLEIERVRLGDRLAVALVVDEAGDCLIPPLLLQPIVENAVKHGIAHVLEGGTITVRARGTPTRLMVTIENPVDADRPRRPGTGLGLANVRERLRAVYGADASLEWLEQAGLWRVEFSLPAVRMP